MGTGTTTATDYLSEHLDVQNLSVPAEEATVACGERDRVYAVPRAAMIWSYPWLHNGGTSKNRQPRVQD